MRIAFCLFALVLICGPVAAQSVMDNLPPVVSQGAPEGGVMPPPVAAGTSVPAAGDVFTVADVNADVTADNAAHARDQALMQAERAAYVQLCARLNAGENAAKLNDDGVAALVQSFEVQSEHVSAKRYIGVFTIRFKPAAAQKKIGRNAPGGDAGAVDDSRPVAVSHVTVAVATDSLAAWTQARRRLGAVPQVAHIDVIDLGRGVTHIDLSYTGTMEGLEDAVTGQGFVLRQAASGEWQLTDGSMVPR